MRYVYEKPNTVYSLNGEDDVLSVDELIERLGRLKGGCKTVLYAVDRMDCRNCIHDASDGCIHSDSIVVVNEKRFCRKYQEW